MAIVHDVTTAVAESQFTVEDLEALEREHPDLGRFEEIDGAIHATGGSAVGDLHQLIVQRCFLLLTPLCPPEQILRVDVWWVSERGKIRADVAVYRPADRPADRKSFRVPAQAIIEVLSDDAFHDVVRKDGVYAEYGVRSRVYIDPRRRAGWWVRVDGVEHTEATVMWQPEGWPPVLLERDALLAD